MSGGALSILGFGYMVRTPGKHELSTAFLRCWQRCNRARLARQAVRAALGATNFTHLLPDDAYYALLLPLTVPVALTAVSVNDVTSFEG
jgi:hypothetical protein